MAATFTPQQSLDYAKRMIGNLPLDDTEIKLRILNDAAMYLHLYAPWSWTVGQFASISLVEDQDDYTVSDPGNVMHLLRGDLMDPNGGRLQRHIWPRHGIPTDDSAKGPVSHMELTSATNIRLGPTPSGFKVGSTLLVYYRKLPTTITDGNISTAATLDFPDEWHWVYNQLVLHQAKVFDAGKVDGVVRVDSQGRMEYTGDYAEREMALQYMRAREKPLKLDTGENQGV